MRRRFTVTANKQPHMQRRRRITAAGEEFNDTFGDDYDAMGDDLGDTIEDIGDAVEDIQDTVEETDEDDPNIDVDNNVAEHYIAECEKCKGIFISAIVETDQEVTSVTGECPLCGEETTQFLKWIIRAVSHTVPEPEDKYMFNQ